jgi:hypothetical protein
MAMNPLARKPGRAAGALCGALLATLLFLDEAALVWHAVVRVAGVALRAGWPIVALVCFGVAGALYYGENER